MPQFLSSILILFVLVSGTSGVARASCEVAQAQAAGKFCSQSFQCESRYLKSGGSPEGLDRRSVCLAAAKESFARTYRRAAARALSCTSATDPAALVSAWETRIVGEGSIAAGLRAGWSAGGNPAGNKFYSGLLKATASSCGKIIRSGGTSAVARAQFAAAANRQIRKAQQFGIAYPGDDPAALADRVATLAAAPVDPANVPNPNPNPNPAPNPQNANPGLTGTLFYDVGDAKRLDFGSGVTISIRALAGESAVSWDGTELASFNIDRSQLLVYGVDGLIRAEFDRSNDSDAKPPIKFSPDGTKLIFFENRFVPATATVIARADGHVIRRFVDSSDQLDSFAWLPDGRLVLARGKDLLVTDTALNNERVFATLPGDVEELEASRDGSRFAFHMANHIWTINADGSGLIQRTLSATDEFSPSFSPDGRYIVLMHDPVRGAGTLWAIPADGVQVWIGSELPTSARQIYYVDPEGELAKAVGGRGLYWR